MTKKIRITLATDCLGPEATLAQLERYGVAVRNRVQGLFTRYHVTVEAKPLVCSTVAVEPSDPKLEQLVHEFTEDVFNEGAFWAPDAD